MTELQAAGAWVFAGGLHPSSTATVVRVDGGEVLITDGPFVEGKEHIGRFLGDQGARTWTRRSTGAARPPARAAVPIEVRPFQDEAREDGLTVSGPALADIERVFRAEYGRAVAVLTRVFGDIDIAEDAVQDAFAEAARRWPAGRAAAEPGRAGSSPPRATGPIDRLRREAARADKHAQAVLLHRRAGGYEEVVPLAGRRRTPGGGTRAR